MIEKVNPSHPDKVADRIAGALVDYCYTQDKNPKCAFEVLIGHHLATVIGETSVHVPEEVVKGIIDRIDSSFAVRNFQYNEVPQDAELAKNQADELRSGDNGIFKGVPVRREVEKLSQIAHLIYDAFPTDGKYILDHKQLTVCQSYADEAVMLDYLWTHHINRDGYCIVNPLGYWTGGVNVDTGATNRKLGSDMGDAVTGGGLHGKDLSKADVAVNIYAHLKAQETGKVVQLSCSIGDEFIDGKPYYEIVDIARKYIDGVGGFEKLAEWGLV